MKEYKDLINEGTKEFSPSTIKRIAEFTNQNQHDEARALAAQAMNDRDMMTAYQAIAELNRYFGHMTSDISKVRNTIDKALFSKLKREYKNGEEVYMVF